MRSSRASAAGEAGAGVTGSAKAGESGAQAEKGSGHGPGGGRGGAGKGGGPGWQTLAQYCSANGIALTNATARLQAKGIKFTADQTLREIALGNGYDRPYELLNVLQSTQ